jgi:hypothetical protein
MYMTGFCIGMVKEGWTLYGKYCQIPVYAWHSFVMEK